MTNIGIFRDVFSVLQNPPVFTFLKELLVKKAKEISPAVQSVVGLDARGFLLGPLIALELQIPFVPIRKKGKLPGKVRSFKYALEYGEVGCRPKSRKLNCNSSLFRTLSRFKKGPSGQESGCSSWTTYWPLVAL